MISHRNTQLLKAFGKHVKYLRLQNKMTQEVLAYDANIPISQVGRIERGEVNPTISTLYVISKALDIPMATLLNFDFLD